MTDRHQKAPYPLRMTDELRDALQQAADAVGRSLNAEIIARLTDSFTTMPTEKHGAPLVRVILDSSGYPQSWDEVDEHLRAIRKVISKPTVAFENVIVTPDMVSSSLRQPEAKKLSDFYREKTSVKVDKMALIKHLGKDPVAPKSRKKS
jgi:hypothetical protein